MREREENNLIASVERDGELGGLGHGHAVVENHGARSSTDAQRNARTQARTR